MGQLIDEQIQLMLESGNHLKSIRHLLASCLEPKEYQKQEKIIDVLLLRVFMHQAAWTQWKKDQHVSISEAEQKQALQSTRTLSIEVKKVYAVISSLLTKHASMQKQIESLSQ